MRWQPACMLRGAGWELDMLFLRGGVQGCSGRGLGMAVQEVLEMRRNREVWEVVLVELEEVGM